MALLGKKFISGDYQDLIHIEVYIENNTDRDIRAYDGMVVLEDLLATQS